MILPDLPFQRGSLAWIILLWLSEIRDSISDVTTLYDTKSSSLTAGFTPSPNDIALMKIKLLLITIGEVKNSSLDDQIINTNEFSNKMDKIKRKDVDKFSDHVNPFSVHSKILDQLKQLCKILNPYDDASAWYQYSNYVSVMTEKQHDRFGCKSTVSILTNSISVYENLTAHLDLIERKLLDWQKKLLRLPPMLLTAPYTTLILSSTSSRPPQSFYQSSISPQVTSSPILRWNKGLSRYDTSWIKTDSKNSDKEIIFYNYDPSQKEEYKVSIGKSVIRIVPAVTVITFLVLCWYFFVYRRMKQRQQRARQLLAQYQAILSGTRVSGNSLMVVSESRARNDTGAQMFICSSSTYDSCLNDPCNTLDESNCAEHCNASATHAEQNDSVPQNISSNTSRPRSYPPTYDEIFPPSYESLYGTVV